MNEVKNSSKSISVPSFESSKKSSNPELLEISNLCGVSFAEEVTGDLEKTVLIIESEICESLIDAKISEALLMSDSATEQDLSSIALSEGDSGAHPEIIPF